MSSDLMWKAVEIYNHVFQWLNEIPIYFNTKTRTLVAIKGKRRLVWWALSVFVVLVLGCGPQLMKLAFFFFKFRGDRDNELGSIYHLMTIFLFFITAGGGPILLILVYIYGDDLVKSFNTFIAFEAMMKKKLTKGKKKRKAASIDILGHILCILPHGSVFVAFILIGFAVYMDLDSPFFILEMVEFVGDKIGIVGELLETVGIRQETRSIWMAILLILVRFCCSIYIAIEICRIFTGLGLIMMVGVWAINHSVIYLHKDYLQRDTTGKSWYIKMYNTIVISLRIFYKLQSFACFILLSGAASVIVFCNYVTFSLYDVLPLGMFILAPIGSISLCAVLHFLLPRAVLCHELSKELLFIWQRDFSTNLLDKPYFGRRVKSLSPIHLYVGVLDFNLIMICKSTKSAYYNEIIEYTYSMLLSF